VLCTLHIKNSLQPEAEFVEPECFKCTVALWLTRREQAKAASLTCSVIAVQPGALVVPGERRLFDVPEQQLEQIIADKGQVRGAAGASKEQHSAVCES
jgi:hypothetical protein